MTKFNKHNGNTVDVSHTILRLFKYWKCYKKILLSVIFFSVIEICCSLLAPLLIGKSIEECIAIVNYGQSVNLKNLFIILSCVTIIYLLCSFSIWYQESKIALISNLAIKQIRCEVFEKLQKLSIYFFDKNLRGEIMSKAINDTEMIKDAFGINLIQILSSLLTLIGTMIIMFFICAKLSLIICLTIPCIFLLAKFITQKTRSYFSEQQKALATLNGLVEENISGLKVIKNFSQERNQINKIKSANETLRKVGTKAQIYSGIFMPFIRVIDNLSYIIIAVIGGIFAYNGIISIGIIQSFLLYTKNFLRPMSHIATQFNTIQSAIAGAERVFTLLDEEEKIFDRMNAKELTVTQGIIEFDNVCFGYEIDKPIINNFSFKTKSNEVVAIVGETGAGKTTLLNLLTRFYDVSSGSIKIDGIDIRDVTQKSLRQSLTVVFQEPYIFSESIKYNVSYGLTNSSIQEIKNATNTANANFIYNLPNEFDTVIKNQSELISYGQKQLLTIARAMLYNRPILIFDEATSNLDTRTELLIQQAISKLTKGKTCFIIAHRLSTIKNADRIIVLSNGSIIEEGKHNELIEKKGEYFKLYNSQFEFHSPQ